MTIFSAWRAITSAPAARICGGDPQGKIVRLADFTVRPHDIADPWYTRDFSTAYAEIEEGVRSFLDRA